MIKKNRKHSKQFNLTKQKNKKETSGINISNKYQQFCQCRQCAYFPRQMVLTAPYFLDKNGVKRRNIKYFCSYDMHEINIKNNTCPRSNSNAI